VYPTCGVRRFDAAQCRCADWYDPGFRDAMYAFQCEGHAKVDVARYAQGWREGRWEADTRTTMSAD
jgi:hypothetical protein